MRLENTFIGAEGVGPAVERRLWRAGITHWDDYDPTALEGDLDHSLDTFITEARDRLADRDSRYFDRRLPAQSRWRLYENFRGKPAFSTSRRRA